MSGTQRILLLGYGNPGRCDDALGPALAEAIEKMGIPGVVVDSDYQLVVEDAHAVAHCDVAIFADADATGPEPFSFRRVEPTDDRIVGFSTHSVSPTEVVTLAREMFGAKAVAFVLGIRGYMFEEFGERLSDKARENLAAATTFIAQELRNGTFTEFPNGKTDNKQAGSRS